MNNVTHHVRFVSDDLNVISASAFVPVYGRLGKLSITTFSRASVYGRQTRVSYGFRAATKDDYYREPFPLDGKISVPVDGRRIEQRITLPPLSGEILQFSYLIEAGEDAGRFVASAIMRAYESVIDDARLHVRRNVPRGQITESIDKEFSRATMRALGQALAGVNWKLLFSKSNADDRTINVIDYTLQHNPVRVIEFKSDATIPAWNRRGQVYTNHELDRRLNEARERFEAERRAAAARLHAEEEEKRLRAADTAVDMMWDVLGESAVDSYRKTGAIHIDQNGYHFEIGERKWIKCTDSNGGYAELCIHTIALSCHPVDEMVLAALNIKHHFREFMELAIYQVNRNFTKPKFAA